MRPTKVIAFRLIAAVLGPLLLLIGLEGLLAWRGIRTAPLLREGRGAEAHWTTNPRYGASIFPRDAGPTLPPIWVPARKAENEIRIVVLGESAAEGFPLPGFSLGQVLQTVLADGEALPTDGRVISLAMTGINSHQIRQLGRAAARRLDPDILILYAGNNEVIGPYGPAAVLSHFHASLRLIRLRQFVRSLRIAQLLDGLRRTRAANTGDAPAWQGLEEFRGVRLAEDDPRLPFMYGHFQRNMEDLARFLTRRGIRMMICTMPVNITDWPPLDAELDDAAEGEWKGLTSPGEAALAWDAYRRGEYALCEEGSEAAWPWFRRALDLDRVRIRADSRINDILRALAPAEGADRVALLDLDRWLHEENPGGWTNQDLFYEHVHLTFTGRLAVCARIAAALRAVEWLPGPARDPLNWMEEAAPRLLFTPLDASQGIGYIRALYRGPQFTAQPCAGERLERLQREEESLLAEIERGGSEKLRGEWERQRGRPVDPQRDERIGRWLRMLGDLAAARMALEAALGENPMLVQARLELARIWLDEDRPDLAHAELLHVWNRFPDHPEALAILGEWALTTGRPTEAEMFFEEAFRVRPSDFSVMMFLARTAQDRQDWDQAEAYYRQGMRFHEQSAPLLNNLAMVLLSRSDPARAQLEEAVRLAEEATQLDSDSPFVWWTAARAYARSGDLNKAIAAADRAASAESVPEPLAAVILRARAEWQTAAEALRHQTKEETEARETNQDGM